MNLETLWTIAGVGLIVWISLAEIGLVVFLRLIWRRRVFFDEVKARHDKINGRVERFFDNFEDEFKKSRTEVSNHAAGIKKRMETEVRSPVNRFRL